MPPLFVRGWEVAEESVLRGWPGGPRQGRGPTAMQRRLVGVKDM